MSTRSSIDTTTMSTESGSYIIPTPAPSLPHHQSRSSLTSLYDLLADFDDTQLQYLIQEMNNTTSQNMAVGQAVSAFETENPSYSLNAARANMQAPTMQRQLSRSQKVRLSLQTMFRAPSVRQQRSRQQDPTEDNGFLSTPTGRRKSPAYKRISRPNFNLPPGITVAHLLNMLEAEFMSSPISPSGLSNTSSSFSGSPSPTTSSSSGRIRRYPSTIDMALEAERSASGVENIGLGMLEPRPMTPCTPVHAGSPMTPMTLTPIFDRRSRGDTPPPPPVVLEGIFEVLETR